jgi:hypothetical protein
MTDNTQADITRWSNEQADRAHVDPSGEQRRPDAASSSADAGNATATVVPMPVARPGRTTPARIAVDARLQAPSLGSGTLTIDCAGCSHCGTDVCSDCVVSFIVSREPDDAVVIDADEARAVRLLERAGLVPGVRHEARVAGE